MAPLSLSGHRRSGRDGACSDPGQRNREGKVFGARSGLDGVDRGWLGRLAVWAKA